ncbi:hypothetical protein ROS62_30185, partial [Streptomyces sp. DSM 41972]|nr:hypothetical protein [Streptomyces sp. DSM 41972]
VKPLVVQVLDLGRQVPTRGFTPSCRLPRSVTQRHRSLLATAHSPARMINITTQASTTLLLQPSLHQQWQQYPI